MKQETVTLNGREIVMVEVPEDCNPYIKKGRVRYKYFNGTLRRFTNRSIILPPGDWQFLFYDPLTPSEDEVKGVVECYGIGNGYRSYEVESQYSELLKKSALESWHSFVRSKGFEVGRVVALLKK